MITLNKIFVKVASRCNINCRYCYVYNLGDDGWASMPKLIENNTIQAIANSLSNFSQMQEAPFSIALHGGEPLLIGPQKLEFLLSTLRKYLSNNYPISIQTNGMLITNDILDICSKYRTSISVSIDGPKEMHNRNRVDHKEKGTYEQVIAGFQKLSNHPDTDFLNSGVLAVIDPMSDPAQVYQFFKELNVPSIDFLHADGNHTNLPPGKSSYESIEYGEWLSGLLDVYLADQHPIKIDILDNMIRRIVKEEVCKVHFVLEDHQILIIETDGTFTKNDILKSTYNHADKFEQPWSVHNGSIEDLLNSNEFMEYHRLQLPSALVCLECPELRVCGGGLPPHRWKKGNDLNNESIYCQDQLFLIENIRHELGIYNSHSLCQQHA